MLDVLIVNGVCPDFERNEMVQNNVGMRDGVIDYVGSDTPEARQVVDAAGKVVFPGFIDIHMHEEKFRREGSTTASPG